MYPSNTATHMFSAKALGEHILIDNGLFILASNKCELRDMRFGMYDQQSLRSACAYAQSSKASDQPAHMRSLIRVFAGRLNILWVLSY